MNIERLLYVRVCQSVHTLRFARIAHCFFPPWASRFVFWRGGEMSRGLSEGLLLKIISLFFMFS